MSAFNWPVSQSRNLQPSKYLPPDLRKLVLALGAELRMEFEGATYRVTAAPIEGEAGLRADYLHYHIDRVVAFMRTLPDGRRAAVLAGQRRLLGETDLSDDEVGLICQLVEGQLLVLDPSPIDDGDGQVVADVLEVRGAVLRARVRDFFRRAVTAGVFQHRRASQ